MGLKRFLMEHYPEKIIAILIACSLWVTFGHRTENVRRDFVIPIEYRNLAENRIINEPKTKEVTITLSGNEQEFNLLKPSELKISLDMSGVRDGENKLVLSDDLVRNPSVLSVVNIDPAQIILNSYQLMPLIVPIELKTEKKPPAGIMIRSIKVEPESISVMVPSTMPRDKISIGMEPIDLSLITQTTIITPRLIVAPDVRLSGEKSSDLKVIIEVEKKEKPNG